MRLGVLDTQAFASRRQKARLQETPNTAFICPMARVEAVRLKGLPLRDNIRSLASEAPVVRRPYRRHSGLVFLASTPVRSAAYLGCCRQLPCRRITWGAVSREFGQCSSFRQKLIPLHLQRGQ